MVSLSPSRKMTVYHIQLRHVRLLLHPCHFTDNHSSPCWEPRVLGCVQDCACCCRLLCWEPRVLGCVQDCACCCRPLCWEPRVLGCVQDCACCCRPLCWEPRVLGCVQDCACCCRPLCCFVPRPICMASRARAPRLVDFHCPVRVGNPCAHYTHAQSFKLLPSVLYSNLPRRAGSLRTRQLANAAFCYKESEEWVGLGWGVVFALNSEIDK
jgi:hypothetical protein